MDRSGWTKGVKIVRSKQGRLENRLSKIAAPVQGHLSGIGNVRVPDDDILAGQRLIDE
ncbi:MAG: hypothetical protein ACYC5X_06225 [Syntrophales bacterium]